MLAINLYELITIMVRHFKVPQFSQPNSEKLERPQHTQMYHKQTKTQYQTTFTRSHDSSGKPPEPSMQFKIQNKRI